LIVAKKRTQEPTDTELRRWIAATAQRLNGDELVLLHEVASALAERGPLALLSASHELSSYTSRATIAAMERLGLG
jgi:hypothetical protein